MSDAVPTHSPDEARQALLAQVAALPAVHTVHVIERGNHVLTLDAWQREMLDISSRWLDEHFLHQGMAPAQPVASTVPA